MKYRALPPLNFLPTFESAGRLQSFKEAAKELGLTPSAVSQQIRTLETSLGVELFDRRTRAVELTVIGRAFLVTVRTCLADLDRVSSHVRRSGNRPKLRLNTVPFVAHELLIPYLSEFRARNPELELQVETTMDVVDFDRSDVDVAIRAGQGQWNGLFAERLGNMIAAPVCSPELAINIKSLDDLRSQTLISIRGREWQGWNEFAARRGWSIDPDSVLKFSSYFETIRAAEQGLGVAFGLFPMTAPWVLSKRLVLPLPIHLHLRRGLFLVYCPGIKDRPDLIALRQWLEERYGHLQEMAEQVLGSTARPHFLPSKISEGL